jgi:hypothetical protein
MSIIKPGGDAVPGLMTTRVCREVFRIDERNRRRAITKGRLPIYIVNEKPMIDPADAVACIEQWGRNHGR